MGRHRAATSNRHRPETYDGLTVTSRGAVMNLGIGITASAGVVREPDPRRVDDSKGDA